jgi:hypothetical protein
MIIVTGGAGLQLILGTGANYGDSIFNSKAALDLLPVAAFFF